MKYAFFAQNRHVPAILLVSAVVFVAIWWLYPHVAESAHTRSEPVAIQPLTPPAGFTAAEDDKDMAFREDDAGFSAYYRVLAPAGADEQSGSARLDISGITDKLTNEPDASDTIRAGAGNPVDIGLNFGIIELPMYAAVIPSAPIENVTVYFDDQGWIVAYLPKGTPAAAIWKYHPQDDKTDAEELENNLLVLAINEVLKADGAAAISPDDVNYYDWQYKNCNAYALFSALAKEGGKSHTVKFVVPRTITEIGASAAVVMTEPIDQGGYNFASIIIDENRVPANTDYPRNAAGFKLARDTNETSLHEMTVYVSEDNKAAGVVMLVYAKPSAS